MSKKSDRLAIQPLEAAILSAARRSGAPSTPAGAQLRSTPSLTSVEGLAELVEEAFQVGDNNGCVMASLLAATSPALPGDLFGSKKANAATTAALYIAAQIIGTSTSEATQRLRAPNMPLEVRLTALSLAVNFGAMLETLARTTDDLLSHGGFATEDNYQDHDLSKKTHRMAESAKKELLRIMPEVSALFAAEPVGRRPLTDPQD